MAGWCLLLSHCCEGTYSTGAAPRDPELPGALMASASAEQGTAPSVTMSRAGTIDAAAVVAIAAPANRQLHRPYLLQLRTLRTRVPTSTTSDTSSARWRTDRASSRTFIRHTGHPAACIFHRSFTNRYGPNSKSEMKLGFTTLKFSASFQVILVPI